MSPVEREIQNLACEEWNAFRDLIGEEAFRRATIIYLRNKGRTYGQIALIVKTSRENACMIYQNWLIKQQR